jgi:hypothetical protein
MIIAGNNMNEFNELQQMSVENYLIRFKLYIDELEVKQKTNEARKK